MKSRIILLLSVVAGLWLAPVHAGNNAAVTPSAQAASARQRGTLFRIRHHGHTSYLFGTIHVGTPDFFPLAAEVTDALAHSHKLVLEIDLRDNAPFQAALQRHGMYAGAETIESRLSADSLAQLKKALQGFGIPYENVRRMKPWLVTNLLLGLDLERHGYQRAQGSEMFLLSQAARQTMTVQGLEPADYQMSLFDGMSDALQEQYLRENLAELNDGSALKKAQILINAWASANGAAIEDFLRESMKLQTASSEFTQRVLLDQRNPEMADKIEALLKHDESAFVGVGLMHLIGDTGVPVLLRARGYEVEKVY